MPRPLREVVAVAERQWGVVSSAQLASCGVAKAVAARWIGQARLHRLYPGVYVLGHRVLRVQGRLMAALLWAGPQAMLSHETAAWWYQLVAGRPDRIHVTGGRSASIRDVRVHRPRRAAREWHRGFPVTSPARTLLDVANVVPFQELRRALAEAEFRRLVRIEDMTRVLRRGRPGSAALRRALEQHQPRLARTKSNWSDASCGSARPIAFPCPG
jgi:predicted transcriptional regulator of viral defense system